MPADSSEDLIAGRDPLASIHFDPEEDDLVSRQHLKITRDADSPGVYRLVDLESRNGTFVNRRRVYGSTLLNHNDCVQLGPSGPEFRFELDPPPAYTSGASTRETSGGFTRDSGGMGPSRPIGRATVERMLDDTFGLLKQESTKGVVVGLLCIAAVLTVGLGTWIYMRKSAAEAAAAQQASQESMERMTLEVQKSREEAERLRAEQARQLEEQRNSDEANRKTLQSLSTALTAIRKNQAAELARQRQIAPPTASAGSAASSGPATFSQLIEHVDSLVAENKYPEAAAVANQMVQLDPNRYEGYFYGGVSALQQKQMMQARTLLQEAIAKAPIDKQTPIQQLLAGMNYGK